MKFAGVVTLYHPQEDVVSNILSYLDELDILYVLDNSETPVTEVVNRIKNLPNIRYIAFGENRGISYALNYALKRCTDYPFLLTMDQDSRFPEGAMRQYKDKISRKNAPDIAAYTLQYTTPRGVEPKAAEDLSVKSTITSGMVLKVDIARALDGFAEELFIDAVDVEFCYRACQKHYKIWLFPGIVLFHTIGAPELRSFLWGKEVIVSNHMPIRRYYITRNNSYLMREHREALGTFIGECIKSPIKVMLFEKDKLNKLRAILLGFYDGLSGNMGKCKRKF